MSSMNQAHVEAICSASYLENYLDCMETFPSEVQRIITQIREINADLSGDTERIHALVESDAKFTNDPSAEEPMMTHQQLLSILLKFQEAGDRKRTLSAMLVDTIEARSQELQQSRHVMDPANHYTNDPPRPSSSQSTSTTASKKDVEPKETVSSAAPPATRNNGGARSNGGANSSRAAASSATRSSTSAASAKKRKAKQEQEEEPPAKKVAEEPQQSKPVVSSAKKPVAKKRQAQKKSTERARDRSRSPSTPEGQGDGGDEEVYCLCQQISYGEMVGCDNDDCEIEWFHFDCVKITSKPKGKWYCPRCRGDRSSVPKGDRSHGKR